jgi:parallel beta-helix repeat protein
MQKWKLLLIFVAVIGLVSLAFALFQDNGSLTQTLYDCGTLNTTNAVYTINQSIDGSGQTCLTVQANNITIDFNGFNITGDSLGADLEDGIYIDVYNDTKIINGIVSGFTRGVYSANNYGLNITGGNYSNNGPADDLTNANDGYGIYLSSSNNFTLSNFIVNDITESIAVGGEIEVSEVAPALYFERNISLDKGVDLKRDIVGIGESIDWFEKDTCYGSYCGLNDEKLDWEIDIATYKAISYEINNFDLFLKNDSTSNNFNVLFLLKIANEIKQNDKIENALPNMTRNFVKTLTQKEYNMYMPFLNKINPEFDLYDSDYYNIVKANAPTSDNFKFINKELGTFAYYCKDVFMKYNQSEKDWIMNYFLNTSLGIGMNKTKLTDYSNLFYATTHSLFYLNMMYKQGCIDKEAVDKAAKAVLFRSKLATHYSDPNLEAPMTLLLANRSDLVRKNWIPIILENQREDGGFPLIQQINESHSHPTGVALVTLLAYSKNMINNKSLNISIPFKSLKENINLSGIAETLPEHNTKYGIYAENSDYGNIIGFNGSCSDAQNSYGIYFINANYNTIDNSVMNDWFTLLSISSSSNNIIRNNSITNANNYGIYFSEANNNIIENNVINSNLDGIHFQTSSDNIIKDNIIHLNKQSGVNLLSSLRNNLTNNDFLELYFWMD